MANKLKRLPENTSGDFYVDSTCIDCETCQWVAPNSFAQATTTSYVHQQPPNGPDQHRALMALIACPVGAIGTDRKHDIWAAKNSFPEHLEDNVYACGFHAAASFGAASYFIQRPEGNVLIDSPRFAGHLLNKIDAMGGIRWMYLTHKDDIAEHQKFRDRYGCDRIIHEDDLVRGLEDAEMIIRGDQPVILDEGLTIIPVPGHTRGSTCLRYADKFLFTGDHLAWSENSKTLRAFRNVCWFDWSAQTASMERLAEFRFEWVLPGHGQPGNRSASEMAACLEDCIAWMRTK
ncbi:MAG: MBL fold metallo-hydrolase [Proteobacteria bacterium]|nr:MBL fold metallo-hydrolase [Pseudomonadota bacterium]